MLDHLTFNCLILCTIFEPVFLRRLTRLKDRLLGKKSSIRASKRFSTVHDPLPKPPYSNTSYLKYLFLDSASSRRNRELLM